MPRRRFGAAIAASGKKTDNARHGRDQKVGIRHAVLADIGKTATVFDGFAGSGAMYRAVWRGAARYVGCDLRFFRDDRTAFVADNRRVLRAIDLHEFSIFDFDAYGSPWEQCLILAARRKIGKSERVGLVITEGSRLKMTFGGLPRLLAELAGVDRMMTGANRSVEEVVDRAIGALCRRWGARVDREWRAESRSVGQARPLYIGMVLRAA